MKSRNGIGSLLGILVLAAVAFILLNAFNLVQVVSASSAAVGSRGGGRPS